MDSDRTTFVFPKGTRQWLEVRICLLAIHDLHKVCTRPADNMDRELGCVCLRWSTTDEVDQSLETEGGGRSECKVNVGEWFRVEPLSSIAGLAHVV